MRFAPTHSILLVVHYDLLQRHQGAGLPGSGTMDFTECSLSQLTQDLEIADPRASDKAVLWAQMLEGKVSGRAGRASAHGRRAHGEAMVAPLLAIDCGCSLSVPHQREAARWTGVPLRLARPWRIDQIDAIGGCSADTVEQRSSVERLKKGHLRGTCRHAYKNRTWGNLFV